MAIHSSTQTPDGSPGSCVFLHMQATTVTLLQCPPLRPARYPRTAHYTIPPALRYPFHLHAIYLQPPFPRTNDVALCGNVIKWEKRPNHPSMDGTRSFGRYLVPMRPHSTPAPVLLVFFHSVTVDSGAQEGGKEEEEEKVEEK